MKALLQMESNFYILRDESQFDLVSCEGRSHSRTLRRMFHSEDIGVSLLGSLKVGDLTSSHYFYLTCPCNHLYYFG